MQNSSSIEEGLYHFTTKEGDIRAYNLYELGQILKQKKGNHLRLPSSVGKAIAEGRTPALPSSFHFTRLK